MGYYAVWCSWKGWGWGDEGGPFIALSKKGQDNQRDEEPNYSARESN